MVYWNQSCKEVVFVKKALLRTAVLSLLVFFISWGVVGLKILDGDYDFIAEAYIALAGMILGMASLLGWKLIGSKCPHCGKIRLYGGKYCSYCGNKIDP